jgi:mRNA interferase MazF
MVIRRGDLFWVDLGIPMGSEPGFRRPVIVIQDDTMNASGLATIIVLSLTSNLGLRSLPGCILLTAEETGLPKDSVANAGQLRTIDKARLCEHIGHLDAPTMFMVDNTLRHVLGL